MLVSELWLLLDEGEEELRLTAPRAHPLDPADHCMHKVSKKPCGHIPGYCVPAPILGG